ncbi:ly6/PLAUR domain-containing protein 2-like isoform 2-T2 [Pelodytes ibericus]
MDTFKVFFLLTIFVGAAFSLRCYTCFAQSSNANCITTITNCSTLQTSCETSVASAAYVGSSITKSCSASCTPVSAGVSYASASVSCCTTDLCNTSGAPSIKSGYTLLALSLGLILTLLRNSSL